jgi:hypothetical protein
MNHTNVIPPTTGRVPVREQHVERIVRAVGETVRAMPQTIDERLHRLNREWDIDRIYETTIGLISVVGLVLGLTLNLWWLVLPAFGAVSLLSHALFGWSIFLMLFRAFGVRTGTEIAYERYALKALRGDFHQIAAVMTPDDREAISTFEGEGGMAYGPAASEPSDPRVVKDVLEAVQK